DVDNEAGWKAEDGSLAWGHRYRGVAPSRSRPGSPPRPSRTETPGRTRFRPSGRQRPNRRGAKRTRRTRPVSSVLNSNEPLQGHLPVGSRRPAVVRILLRLGGREQPPKGGSRV